MYVCIRYRQLLRKPGSPSSKAQKAARVVLKGSPHCIQIGKREEITSGWVNNHLRWWKFNGVSRNFGSSPVLHGKLFLGSF